MSEASGNMKLRELVDNTGVSTETIQEIGFNALNLMGFYFFFLFRKLAQKDTLAYIEQREQKKHVS
jgi:hypothetical protein